MKKFNLAFLIISICFFASSCGSIQPYPDNQKVRLIFYNEINIAANIKYDCDYLGTLISSDGHWYNYLFISNTDLTQGAINDMYNKANKIGADIVYIDDNIDFATSVTLLGQAYNCTRKDDNR
jgi:pimeloyl-CoA synthetase